MKKQTFISTLLLFFMIQIAGAQQNRFDPPWNKPPTSGVNFTIKGIDNVPDIHGDITDPQLVVFMGGNQFMVVDDLIAAFKKEYPQYERILVETLPPGLLMQQIKTGSLVIGNMRLSYKPDIYTAGKKGIAANAGLFEKVVAYSANKLALMVAKGNPKNITGLQDLKAKNIRISMPDKKIEGIGESIEETYKKAGGDGLYHAIMVDKVKDGSTFITQIHHRQSPMRILYKQSDVAPVWETEIDYQKSIGHPVDKVAIADAFNKVSITEAGILKEAPHKEAAQHFLNFLVSKEAQSIFKKFGFSIPL